MKQWMKGTIALLAAGLLLDAGARNAMCTVSAAAGSNRAGVLRVVDGGAAENGAEQLKRAYAVKKKSFKQEAEVKQQHLLAAVEEYRKVHSLFPDDRESGALAWFRIGEIQRSLSDSAAAEKAFREVLTYSEQHATVARAFLELGHLARRAKELDTALNFYGQVVRQCAEVRDQGARALIWSAKCHRARKTFAEARQSLRTVIDEYSEQSKSMMAAYDLLALVYLDEDNATMAADTLRECRERFAKLEASGDRAHVGAVARVDKLKAWKQLEKKRTTEGSQGG